MKLLKTLGVFFLSFFLFYIFACIVFPVDENNILQEPDWYTLMMFVAPIAIAVIYRKKRFKKTEAKIDNLETENAQTLLYVPTPNLNPETCLDELLPQAVEAVLDAKMASVSMLQQRLNLGYSRAARIVDQMEEIGVVGPFEGSKPRAVLITKSEWDVYQYEILEVIDKQKEKEREESELRMEKLKAKVLAPGMDSTISDEDEWRRQQYGLTPIEYELKKVDGMEGHQFEYWCADLLRKNGFSDVEVTPGSGDQGVDVLAEKDGIRFAIQCKCYSHDLGNSPVQEVHTGKVIYRCQIGVVMTNRYFTSGAKQAAEATGVLLWDRDQLVKMIESAQ